MSKFIDRTGQVFGYLTALEYIPASNECPVGRWKCVCKCGNPAVVRTLNLATGHTLSCGCLKIEAIKTVDNSTHGMTGTPTYRSWRGMKGRCYSPDQSHQKNYNGIRVCQGWMKFENVLADLGERPDGMEIDRWPDKRGNYSCGKCDECLRNGWKLNGRWATRCENENNKRNNVLATCDGRTQTMMQWAREFNVHYEVFCGRVKRGWSVKEALTTPCAPLQEKYKTKAERLREYQQRLPL